MSDLLCNLHVPGIIQVVHGKATTERNMSMRIYLVQVTIEERINNGGTQKQTCRNLPKTTYIRVSVESRVSPHQGQKL